MDCDTLVIGAGVIGLSSAYYIKKNNPSKKVVVIDMYGGPGQGSTAKSAGGFRNLFTSTPNRTLAEATIEYMGSLERSGFDIKMHHTSYLYLLGKRQYGKRRKAFKDMEKSGVELKQYESDELMSTIPDLVCDVSGVEAEMMGLESIELGIQGVNCGVVDADALARSYESQFIGLGGEIHYITYADRLVLGAKEELGLPGEPFVWQDIEVTGAETGKGMINADTTVLAAGVWAERLLDPIGIDAMMRPKNRSIFVFKDQRLERLLNTKGFNEDGVLPLTQIPEAGVYLKADLSEGSIWLGVTEDIGRKYGLEDDPQADDDTYSGNAYYSTVNYLPCFENVRPINMWAGQRAVNSFDMIPVVEETSGLIYLGASSGNGIMKCDSLGRMAATLSRGEKDAELYGGKIVHVPDFSIKNRNVEKEKF